MSEDVTNPTTSVEVRSWIDSPEEGRSADDWPYPDEHTEYLIGGQLADQIRARTGQTGDVIFEELNVSGGWSEYTQENDYSVTIKVGDFTKTFDGNATFGAVRYYSAIPRIVAWLNRADDAL